MPTTPRFLPWIPTGRSPRFAGVRLLVLGESHYEEPDADVFDQTTDDPCFTAKIVQQWGATPTGRQRFFANLYETLTDERWSLGGDHGRVWRHVFFYDYVQSLVADADERKPTQAQFDASSQAFRSLLEWIRPEAVLVMGERLWQAMVAQDEWIEDLTGALGRVCAYRLTDGVQVLAAHTWHPSARTFRPEDWRPKVRAFLSDVVAYHGRQPDASPP